MPTAKQIIKQILNEIPITKKYMLGRYIYSLYKNSHDGSRLSFLHHYWNKIECIPALKDKTQQFLYMVNVVDIEPFDNNSFFYSIDCFKHLELTNHILDNYSIDYSEIVSSSFADIKKELENSRDDVYSKHMIDVIEGLKKYLERCRNIEKITLRYKENLDAIQSLFERPSQSFFEALQRILFYNQFLWQTKHKHNGFGHLDWLLIDLYRHDIECEIMTKDEGHELMLDFFRVLHEECWYKSSMLLGDTGQIIILGGLNENIYVCNELTYEFINVTEELHLPDPKVLLRCSQKMPAELLESALNCIATGIGAPFLSNDDVVIPALISYGYDAEDAYNYATSACWEPLILNKSCDQNNIQSINFAKPFVEMMDSDEFNNDIFSMDKLIDLYSEYLKNYLNITLSKLSKLIFEEDPLISLVSKSSRKNERDIVRGGAVYANLGVTSVGMCSVVNSMLNIERLAFKDGKVSIEKLNEARKRNFSDEEDLLDELKKITSGYGSDSREAIELTNKLCNIADSEFGRYKTKLGGHFKFGLSSPNYLIDAKSTKATLDGRKDFEPFTVHISSPTAVSPTELLSFAMQLNYNGNRINGNVVDLMVPSCLIKNNKEKFLVLLRNAFSGGLYQIQFNVVDSTTLIQAKQKPESFPNLIVRVWGFSAYFNDLPEEYKDLLIQRALESEKVA